MSSCKLLLIILDGANNETINLIPKDSFIKKLMKKGYYNTSSSVLPPLSVPASISLYTGLNPAKLGIISVQKNDMSLNTSKDVENGTTVWDLLNKNGYTCGVVNALLTWPPKKINGFLVSGYPTPCYEKDYTYPKWIENEIRFLPPIDLEKRYSKYQSKIKVLEEQKKILQNNFDVTKKLFNEFKTDFLCLHITGTDYLQHMFYTEKQILRDFYQELDIRISELYNYVKPERIIIASDHGFSEFPRYKIHLNKFLEEKGYIKIRGNSNINAVLSFIIPERIKSRIVSTNKMQVSRHFSGINIANKDLTNKIIDDLKTLEFNQEKVFQIVKKKEEIYNGRYIDMFPDIVLLPNEKFLISTYHPKRIFSNTTKKDKKYREITLQGIHHNSVDSIIITDIQLKKEIKLSVLDILPLILHYYNIPIPKNIDGKILNSYFENNCKLKGRKILFGKENDNINEIIDEIDI